MEAKIRVVTKKVTTVINSLKCSLEKKNPRLINKYVLQLRDNIENLDQVLVSAQVEGVSPDVDYLVESNKVSEMANLLLIEADKFFVRCRGN